MVTDLLTGSEQKEPNHYKPRLNEFVIQFQNIRQTSQSAVKIPIEEEDGRVIPPAQ